MIATKYIFFAVISTLVNLFAQFISFSLLHNNYVIYIAILNGTIAGLILKYYLDKNYIFQFSNNINKRYTFLPYLFTSIFTTLIFWITELWFIYYLDIAHKEYLGAIIGLSLGYTLKYFLDKHFVFNE